MKLWLSPFRPARALVMLALCGLAVSACLVGKPAVKTEKLRLAYSTNVNAALVYVALEKGFFAREGLDVKAQGYAFGRLALQSVLDGKADVGTVADTPVAVSVIAGEPLMVIASIQTAVRNEAIVARGDRGIEKPADLRGKRLGVTRGTTSEYFAHVVLLSQGIPDREVAIVNLNPSDMREALDTGKVDAVSTWNPTIELLKRRLGDNGRLFYAEPYYTETMCVATRADWLKANPEAERRFLMALVDAQNFVRDHEGETRDLVARLLGLDRSLLDSFWNIFTFRVGLGQGFLVDLEDQARWILEKSKGGGRMPNFLSHFDLSGLAAIDPYAVDIIR